MVPTSAYQSEGQFVYTPCENPRVFLGPGGPDSGPPGPGVFYYVFVLRPPGPDLEVLRARLGGQHLEMPAKREDSGRSPIMPDLWPEGAQYPDPMIFL